MTAPPRKSAPRVAALRERRAALGLVRVEVWVLAGDAKRVRQFAHRLTREKPRPA